MSSAKKRKVDTSGDTKPEKKPVSDTDPPSTYDFEFPGNPPIRFFLRGVQLPNTPAFEDITKLPKFGDLNATAFGIYKDWMLSKRITLYNFNLNRQRLTYVWNMTGEAWLIGDRAQDKVFRQALINKIFTTAKCEGHDWPGVEVFQYLSDLSIAETSKDFMRLMGDIWMKYWHSGPKAWWVTYPTRAEAMRSLPELFKNMLLERIMPDEEIESYAKRILKAEDYLTDFD